MEHKYLFGSKMLKLNNTRDEDWMVFIDDKTSVAREKKCFSIPFYKKMIECFVRGRNIIPHYYNASYLYQLSAPFINDENYPFKDFNILWHKDVWVEWLKAYINSKEVEEKALKGDVLPKYFYHILYQYHMIKENIHFISDEAKVDVQKIHDYEMPSSYFYELRDLINGLN